MSGSTTDGFAGQADDPSIFKTPFNVLSFLVDQMQGGKCTAEVVRVVSVTNAGGVTPVGQVDVLPLVNQIDGAGNATPHETVHGMPYFRLQGGANAIILDPEVGDIGVAVFASRDISTVKATKAQANPGSRRRFDMADGLYLGGFLNGAPTQYVQFSTAGISIVSPAAIILQAMAITLTSPAITLSSADVQINGASFKHNGVNVGSTHVHTAPAGGGATTVPE